MNKMILSALSVISFSLSLVACGSSGSSTAVPEAVTAGDEYSFEKNDAELSAGFKTAASDFSAELLKKVCAEDIAAGKNALVSPESVMLSLGLAANGAGGQTLKEFETLLGGDTETFNSDLSALMTAASSSEDVKFNIANSIWVREDERININKSYAETCKKRLDAESFLAPFNNGTLDKLNGWVSQKTDGMIDKILEEFAEDDLAVLINCIAFDAQWLSEYEDNDVKSGIFHPADGSKQICEMLSSDENIYLSDDSAEGFMKYYKGGRYAFAAMLPNEGVSLSDYVAGLTGSRLTQLLTGAQNAQVEVSMPEFKFDYSQDITDSVKSIGAQSAFTKAADFSNLSDAELYISSIVHKTHIEVSREGTKAAAATEVTITAKGLIIPDENVKRIVLDRPYLFMIVDTQTSLPVFIGAVNTVE